MNLFSKATHNLIKVLEAYFGRALNGFIVLSRVGVEGIQLKSRTCIDDINNA